jgi:hypothetical protein
MWRSVNFSTRVSRLGRVHFGLFFCASVLSEVSLKMVGLISEHQRLKFHENIL